MSTNGAPPQKADPQLLVPGDIEAALPSMVRTELAQLTASQQDAFIEEFRRKSKNLAVAYLCSFIFCHYGYFGRWGMTVTMWIASIATFGIAGLVWWLIDLFRMPGLKRDYNRDIALEVMRNFKAIHS